MRVQFFARTLKISRAEFPFEEVYILLTSISRSLEWVSTEGETKLHLPEFKLQHRKRKIMNCINLSIVFILFLHVLVYQQGSGSLVQLWFGDSDRQIEQSALCSPHVRVRVTFVVQMDKT